MKKIVIIPAYNEAENIEKVISKLRSQASEFDYIVINDSSNDATVDVLKKLDASYIDLPINLGIGGAVQAGYMYAWENGYDIAIQMDGDGQHDPKFLKELCHDLETETADICIGSRFITYDGFQSSRLRRVGISFLSGLIYWCTGKKIKDVTSGYRAVNRKVLKLFVDSYPQDYPEPESIVMALRCGARVHEIPVVMSAREFGCSSISMRKSIYYMIKVSLALILANMIGRKGSTKL